MRELRSVNILKYSMTLDKKITDILLHADGKALATIGGDFPHVVPVSTIKVVDDQIILVNYFFNATLENILTNQNVALSCWKGLSGYQIKAIASYETNGIRFDEVTDWITEILPERIVKGILILTPVAIFDVTATAKKPGAQIY